jgi:enolase-phosphatase E1
MSDMGASAKVFLVDVEGTVAPISVVQEEMFPYARARFEQFLWESERQTEARAARGEDVLAEGSVWRDLMALGAENRGETDAAAPRIWPAWDAEKHTGTQRVITLHPDEAIPKFLDYIYWLMERDRKSTALKSLQGKIWRAGFEAGELKGKLFADVPEALERWARDGRVAIYSSGSVEAQQLLFRYSSFGDLSGLISANFDTRVGAKREAASYTAIAAEMHVLPGETLFFSDVVAELDAAREAGCGTRLVVRPGNVAVEDGRGHVAIETFDLL